MNKSKMLRALARRQGLCDEWYNKWDEFCDDEELLQKAEMGMHFICKYDYPGLESARKMFDKEQLKMHNIYLDQKVFLGNFNGEIKNHDILLMGNTSGMIVYKGYAVANVYVMHNCELTIECNNLCKVFITASGNAKLNVISNDAASVYVYRYGNVTCNTKGDVKIKERENVKIEKIL